MTMLTFSYSCNFSAYWRTKTKNNRKIAVYTISKKAENLPTDSIFKNVSHFTLLFLQATMRLRLTIDKIFFDKLENYCRIFRDTLNYFRTLVSNEATLKNNKCTSNLNVITLWSTSYAIVFICTELLVFHTTVMFNPQIWVICNLHKLEKIMQKNWTSQRAWSLNLSFFCFSFISLIHALEKTLEFSQYRKPLILNEMK